MTRETDCHQTSRAAPLASPPRFDTVITIFLAIAGWHANLSGISDNSFFCHLRIGQWILDHGIPHADIFSFTAAGTPWVAESWLADLLYAVLDRWFGPAGVTTMNAAVGAAIAALWYRLALRVAFNWVAVVVAFAMGGWWTIRAWANPGLDFRKYPVAAMEAVESQGLLGRRLLTTDSWGDYVILR